MTTQKKSPRKDRFAWSGDAILGLRILDDESEKAPATPVNGKDPK